MAAPWAVGPGGAASAASAEAAFERRDAKPARAAPLSARALGAAAAASGLESSTGRNFLLSATVGSDLEPQPQSAPLPSAASRSKHGIQHFSRKSNMALASNKAIAAGPPLTIEAPMGKDGVILGEPSTSDSPKGSSAAARSEYFLAFAALDT